MHIQKEVEAELDQIPGVAESAVIGVPHPDFKGRCHGNFVREVDSDVSWRRCVGSALLADFARYKQPKRVVFADERRAIRWAKYRRIFSAAFYLNSTARKRTRLLTVLLGVDQGCRLRNH